MTAKENDYISSFLNNIASSHSDQLLGDGLNFTDDWLPPPPRFVGSTTSFGQQPGALAASPNYNTMLQGHLNGMPGPSSSMMLPPRVPHSQSAVDQQPSADVLAAAAMLPNMSMANMGFLGLQGPGHAPVNRGMDQFLQNSQPQTVFDQSNRRTSNSYVQQDMHDNTFTDMMFRHQPSPQPNQPLEVVRWGSDTNFNQSRFIPPSEKETLEALEDTQVGYLQCLEVNQSANNTRPSSPVHNGLTSPLRLKTRELSIQTKQEVEDGPPKKRQRNRVREEADDAGDEAQTNGGSPKRRRKSKSNGVGAASPSASPVASDEGAAGKRRKSSTKNGSSKAPRENLTEEQRRANHIKSERKRRTHIKGGFEELVAMVPALKGGGFAKSAVLHTACDWVEDMVKGNQLLNEQLRRMGIEMPAVESEEDS